MKKAVKKSILLKLEPEINQKLSELQEQMGGVSMTQAIKNLIMNRATKPKPTKHLLALCGLSTSVITNLEFILKSDFNEEEKWERLKDLDRYKIRINRILRRYKY